jgi:hypothetical protein
MKKRKIFSFILGLTILGLTILGCHKNQDIIPNASKSNDIDGSKVEVSSIRVLSLKDSDFQRIQKSYRFLTSEKTGEPEGLVAAEYIYSEGENILGRSIVFSIPSEEKIGYVEVSTFDGSQILKNLKISWTDSNGNSKMEKDELQIIDFTNPLNPINIGTFASGGWGDCMKAAITQLYDDWNNDPVGTAACWATGINCAIGGGIACGIKQIF